MKSIHIQTLVSVTLASHGTLCYRKLLGPLDLNPMSLKQKNQNYDKSTSPLGRFRLHMYPKKRKKKKEEERKQVQKTKKWKQMNIWNRKKKKYQRTSRLHSQLCCPQTHLVGDP